MSGSCRKELSQTKIRDFRRKIFVKQYITSFNISMNNMRLDFLMKKREASCHPYANMRPYFPAELNTTVTSSYIIS